MDPGTTRYSVSTFCLHPQKPPATVVESQICTWGRSYNKMNESTVEERDITFARYYCSSYLALD